MSRVRRSSSRLVLIVVLCGTALFTAATSDGHEEVLPPMPAPARPPGPILAMVNGMPVTWRDCEDAAPSLSRDRRSAEAILRKAIQHEILRQAAIRLGFNKDPALKRRLDLLRDEYVKDQLVQREAERLGGVSDAELRRYYEAHTQEPALRDRTFDGVKGKIREEFIRTGLQRRFEELYAQAERQGLVRYEEEAIARPMNPRPHNPAPDAVLVTVNGTAITVHDFGHAFSSLDDSGKGAARKDPKAILRGLAVDELRRQEGLRLGLDRNAAFVQYLEQHTRAYLLHEVMKPVLARVAPISEEALRQSYEAHKDRFIVEDEIVARHILLKTREAARATLAELRAGADFAALARARSEDAATKADGGRLPTIRRGQITPEFEHAVFGLEHGEISGIVEDNAGFHVIKVDQRSRRSVIPFETVKGWLQRELTVEARQAATERYLTELEQQATITIDEEALTKIRTADR